MYVGAFWGDRKETASECAERLSSCLLALSEIDPLLGSWRHRGRSKSSAQRPVDLCSQELTELMKKGQNRRDTDGSVMERLGFTFGIWNGQEPGIGLRGSVGASHGIPGLMNRVIVDLPTIDSEVERLYHSEVALRILSAVVEAWEPDWATWTSHSLRDAQKGELRVPVIGWMTYLSGSRLNAVGAAKVGAGALNDGWLIRTTDDVSSIDVNKVLDTQRHLSKIGALMPTP
jgi:hypothetical protein